MDRPSTIVPSPPRLTLLRDLVEMGLADATDAHQAYKTGRKRGVETPWSALTALLGGYLSPGLHIVHGPPGLGKTAFGLQLAAGCGFPALFVTCEMAPLELLRRHISRETDVYLGRFRTGEIDPATWLAFARKACAAAPDLAIADATKTPAMPGDVRDWALNVKGDAPHALVVVDSLHSWSRGMSGETEYERLASGLDMLSAIAAELCAPIVAISERSRGGMKGGMHAGAGHRSIEYSAESVLELDRVTEAANADRTVGVTVTVSKNRHGEPGKSVDFRFAGAVQRFTEDV